MGLFKNLPSRERKTTMLIPCEKCRRLVAYRFTLRPVFTPEGTAQMKVVWKRDPHICPRPTSGPPPATKETTELRSHMDEAIALFDERRAA